MRKARVHIVASPVGAQNSLTLTGEHIARLARLPIGRNCRMSAELIIWGLIPAAIAASLIASAARIVASRRTLPQIGLSVSIVVLSVVSLWILYEIFARRAWPTFLPHLAIGVATSLAVLQSGWFDAADSQARPTWPKGLGRALHPLQFQSGRCRRPYPLLRHAAVCIPKRSGHLRRRHPTR